MPRIRSETAHTDSDPAMGAVSSFLRIRKRCDSAAEQLPARELQASGCPACRPLAEMERKYFFWFLTENYSSGETYRQLVRAGGFCHAHSDMLTGASAAESHALVSACHRVISHYARKLEKRSGKQPAFSANGPCPACISLENAARRQLERFAATLCAKGMEAYREPALLCDVHLHELVTGLPWNLFEPLLERHRSLLEQFLEKDPSLEEMSASLCIQSRAVGFPKVAKDDPEPEENAVYGLVQRLEASKECPVCISERRAWQEWVHWLDGGGREDEELEDCLPLCVTHVRALIASIDNSALHRIALLHAHQMTLDRLDAALLAQQEETTSNSSRGALARALGHLSGFHRRHKHQHTLEANRRFRAPVRCPICNRIAQARRETLRLLCILLREPHHRASYRRGHGLCLHHCEQALALHPDPKAETTLRESGRTTLEVIAWEFSQAERKQRWDARPEHKGEESDTWRTALRRLSGSLLPPDYDVPPMHVRENDRVLPDRESSEEEK